MICLPRAGMLTPLATPASALPLHTQSTASTLLFPCALLGPSSSFHCNTHPPVPSLPDSSTRLQVQFKCHSFQGNFPLTSFRVWIKYSWACALMPSGTYFYHGMSPLSPPCPVLLALLTCLSLEHTSKWATVLGDSVLWEIQKSIWDLK